MRAAKSTNAIFANSEIWILTGPIISQRFAPRPTVPKRAVKTRRATQIPQNTRAPAPRKKSCFPKRMAATANTMPITTNAHCLIASPVESPCSTKAVIDEEEYTMTRPKTTKASVDKATITRGAMMCAGALLKNEREGDLLRLEFVCSARGIILFKHPFPCFAGLPVV